MFTKFEFEVLNTLWRENRGLTKQEVIQLTSDKTWKPASADYILKTLIEKGAVAVEGFTRSDAKHYSRTFKATITSEEYTVKHLSEAIPSVNFAGVFSHLLGDGKINEADVSELRQLLENFEASEEPIK